MAGATVAGRRFGAGRSMLSVECSQYFSFAALFLFLLALAWPAPSFAGVRLRDMVMISGARDNQLVGYGLVVGLAGDGDKDQAYTKQTVANMLSRYGINIPAATLSAKNVAVVMITADIPPFLKPGARLM